MERKYYFRGLGIGIAVTAIIMGIVTSHDKSMTDREIIARAKELGMVENTVLADMTEEETEMPGDIESEGKPDNDSDGAEQEESSEDRSIDAEESGGIEDKIDGEVAEQTEDMTGTLPEQDMDTEETKETESDSLSNEISDEIGDPNAEASNEEREDSREIITSAAVKTITINSGDGSHTVAKKLADVGVVTSADTFDDFLCRNGYDKKLRTGTFSIPADASDEQIARIVTGAE